LDPVGVFKQGTPDSVRAAVKALLEKTAGYPNFIISSGCDLPPHVPVENIVAFLNAVNG
jgi:uroporphyrinogen decarboxylase